VDKLIIDPVVQAVLGTAAVAQLFDTREHTEIGCPWCGGSIPPEDPVSTTVVVGATEDRKFLVNFAHESCMSSQIYDLDTNLAFEEPPPVSFTAYPILRAPPAPPRAVILFELAGTFFCDAGSGEDLNKLSFLRRGWEPVTNSFDRITAARLPGLSVKRRADTIAVDDDKENVELIAFSNSVVPSIWWEAAAAEGAALIVYGSGLGLERFRWTRVHDALQASTCVAAAAQVESWARLEAVESAEAASLDQSHADVSSLSAGPHFLVAMDELDREDELYVTVYDSDRRRCSAWFKFTGPGRGEMEAAIERLAATGAQPLAVAAGLEALARGEREQAERVVRESLKL
jgi:hypothetical protein